MQLAKNFIVVDTEGKNKLREIAVINCKGKLKYEAFAEEHPDNYRITLNKKSLQQILIDFNNLVKDKVVIFHNASHDLAVLSKSYKTVGIKQDNFAHSCTYQLAKKYFPNSVSFSLENLSKQLNLQVNRKYFNANSAHFARIDNTLDLYEKLGEETSQKNRDYWQHIEKRINEWWFSKYGGAGYSPQILKGIIKFCAYRDPNRRQLVTRWLAADCLNSEELEKIGLDNWQDTMSREAFSLEAIAVLSKLSLLDEPLIIVFDQLEGLGLDHNRDLLLSFGEAIKEIFTHVPNSLIILNFFPERWEQFKTIFDTAIVDRASQFQISLNKPKSEQLKDILQLKLNSIGVKVENFFTESELKDILECKSIRSILNRAADYYRHKVNKIALPSKTQDVTGTDTTSLQEDNLNQRLEALEKQLISYQQIFTKISQVISELGIPDTNGKSGKEPPIIEPPIVNPSIIEPVSLTIKNYITETKEILLQEYQKPQIIADYDDIGKLRSIVEAFKSQYTLTIDHLMLGKKRLPEHLLIQNNKQQIYIGFLGIGGNAFTARIKNHNDLVINHKNTNFLLLRDCRQDSITGRTGKNEIDKLNHTKNGKFKLLNQEDRINFELIYGLVVAIENKDLDVSLEQMIAFISEALKNYWLVKILTSQ